MNNKRKMKKKKKKRNPSTTQKRKNRASGERVGSPDILQVWRRSLMLSWM
jgi:hypothetical protein